MPSPSDLAEFLAAAEVFILSGGAARRAGGINKSLIEVADDSGRSRPIIEQQLARLRPLFAGRITVITDRATDFAPFGLRTLPDFDEARPEDRFPLRGFARALAAARAWAFLLAADMPWPDADLIRRQAARILSAAAPASPGPPAAARIAPEISGLVLLHAGRHQPFHAFYHARLAGSARAAITREDRSLRAWITSEPAILTVPALDLLPDPAAVGRAFTGFNAAPSS